MIILNMKSIDLIFKFYNKKYINNYKKLQFSTVWNNEINFNFFINNYRVVLTTIKLKK